jgi:hypothetical protein
MNWFKYNRIRNNAWFALKISATEHLFHNNQQMNHTSFVTRNSFEAVRKKGLIQRWAASIKREE